SINRELGSLSIGNLTGIVSEIELAQVAVKVLLADVMIDTIKAALQVREEPFDSISRDTDTILITNVLFGLVVHLAVFVKLPSTPQDRRRVGHRVGGFVAHLLDDRPQILGRDSLDVPRLASSVPLKHGNNRRFVRGRG